MNEQRKRRERPLLKYFVGIEPELGEVQLTFDEIEQIGRAPLPGQARREKSWWQHDRSEPYDARAWLRAGWHVKSVDIKEEWARFERDWEDEPRE